MEDSDEPDTFIFEGNSLNTLGKSEPDYGAILWCVCVLCTFLCEPDYGAILWCVCVCVVCTFLCEPDYGAILWCVCVCCAHFYVNQIMVLFCGVCVCVVHIFMCIFFSQRKILVDFPERSQIYFYPHGQLW